MILEEHDISRLGLGQIATVMNFLDERFNEFINHVRLIVILTYKTFSDDEQ